MNIVEENGGLRNTLAMESHDKGYADCTEFQRQMIDARVDQLGRCPKCGEAPTHQTPDGTFWDSSAHYWRGVADRVVPDPVVMQALQAAYSAGAEDMRKRALKVTYCTDYSRSVSRTIRM